VGAGSLIGGLPSCEAGVFVGLNGGCVVVTPDKELYWQGT